MSDCLAFNEMPDVLQGAAQRLPRKSPGSVKTGTGDASRQASAHTQNSTNNYLAEAGQTSPLGGRNRRGAGAPLSNRNARCRVFRSHLRLQKRLLESRLQLLVWSAAVAHFEQALARPAPFQSENHANNFVAEGAMRRAQVAAASAHLAKHPAKIASSQSITAQNPYSNANLDAAPGGSRSWETSPTRIVFGSPHQGRLMNTVAQRPCLPWVLPISGAPLT